MRPPQRGRGLWPCSSGSTFPVDSLPGGRIVGIAKGSSSSRGSNTFHQNSRNSPPLSAFADHVLSLLASRLPSTIHAEQYRRAYVRSPAAERRNGARSVADFGLCRFRHHVGNKPNKISHLGQGTVFTNCLPSWQNTALWRSHCPAPASGYYPKSLEARIARLPPSCARSSPALALVLSPIGTVPFRHRIPYTHG